MINNQIKKAGKFKPKKSLFELTNKPNNIDMKKLVLQNKEAQKIIDKQVDLIVLRNSADFQENNSVLADDRLHKGRKQTEITKLVEKNLLFDAKNSNNSKKN